MLSGGALLTYVGPSEAFVAVLTSYGVVAGDTQLAQTGMLEAQESADLAAHYIFDKEAMDIPNFGVGWTTEPVPDALPFFLSTDTEDQNPWSYGQYYSNPCPNQ